MDTTEARLNKCAEILIRGSIKQVKFLEHLIKSESYPQNLSEKEDRQKDRF